MDQPSTPRPPQKAHFSPLHQRSYTSQFIEHLPVPNISPQSKDSAPAIPWPSFPKSESTTGILRASESIASFFSRSSTHAETVAKEIEQHNHLLRNARAGETIFPRYRAPQPLGRIRRSFSRPWIWISLLLVCVSSINVAAAASILTSSSALAALSGTQAKGSVYFWLGVSVALLVLGVGGCVLVCGRACKGREKGGGIIRMRDRAYKRGNGDLEEGGPLAREGDEGEGMEESQLCFAVQDEERIVEGREIF